MAKGYTGVASDKARDGTIKVVEKAGSDKDEAKETMKGVCDAAESESGEDADDSESGEDDYGAYPVTALPIGFYFLRFPNNYAFVSAHNCSTGVSSASLHKMGVGSNSGGRADIVWVGELDLKEGDGQFAILITKNVHLNQVNAQVIELLFHSHHHLHRHHQRSGFHLDNLKHFKRRKNGKKNIVEVRSTKKIYCQRFAARPKNQNSQSTHSYSESRTSKEKRTKEKSGEVKSTRAAHAIEEDLVDDAIVSEKQREQEHLEKDTEEQEETEHLDENIEVQPNEETSSGKEPKEKRTRGPTTLSKVHSRRMEERKPIVLNVHFQPVGPDDSTLNEFSSFLGTIARNSGLAPLNYESWRKVPYKKELWKYVKKRYIVPEEGKRWVLKTIGDNWRVYKCRLKKNHYYKFKTDKSRLASRPSQVPETQFKALLNYWNTDFIFY
ncbi:uncharacterized protein LOC126668380 [Mercurialis annua]|uniref:uncharacterized protein LOC126668380 n=1 Tax=Mercurialis annua TaxID=3986 RepID=UPI0024AF7B78|nr:uncharacterized protein LOC126668380 [Mercurialis annua]